MNNSVFMRTAMVSASIIGVIMLPFFGIPATLVSDAQAASIINQSFSAKQGPFLDTAGGHPNATMHWQGAGQQAPQLLVSGLQAGDTVTISNVSGSVNWGGNGDGTANPSTCANGPDAEAQQQPKLIAIGQFTNEANQVVAVPFTTPNNRNAPHLKSFAPGIVVPAGATKLWGSYPDSDYTDNVGTCSVNITVTPRVIPTVVPTPTPTPAPQQPVAACNDGRDNDGDGLVDMLDPGCDSFTDNSEDNAPTQCPVGKIFQYGTFHGPNPDASWSEFPANNQFSTNFTYPVTLQGSATPNGPGYLSNRRMSEIDPNRALTDATSNLQFQFFVGHYVTNANVIWSRYGSESNVLKLDNQVIRTSSGSETVNSVFRNPITLAPGMHILSIQYQGGGQNNGNYLDAIGMTGCVGALVPTPTPTPTPVPQCRDGIDNDGDGAIDYPADFSCSNPNDNDETLPKAQCQDNLDNDGDAKADRLDPGCWTNSNDPNTYNPQDNDERNVTPTTPQCRDNIDNDGDGAIDFPADFSCSGPDDNDETLPKAQCQDAVDNDGDGLVDRNDPGCWINPSNPNTYNPQDNDERHDATPTPTPTPTPDDEDEDDDEDKDKGLMVEKSDDRDVTRPGHTLTYEIKVKNTGEEDLGDVEITDRVPASLTILDISSGGTRSGNTVTWDGIHLDGGETKTFTIKVKVKDNVANGVVITNKAEVRSGDHDLKDTDSDSTTVQRLAVVKGTTVPVTPIHVPVTAKTGAGLLGAIASLVGSAGLAITLKRGL